MRVKFDIKYRPQVESGEYQVETVDGRKARIICWDAAASDGRQDIVVLAGSNGESENVYRYYSDGTLISDSAGVGNKDLRVIIPQKFGVGDWIKYNGNIYAITRIDELGCGSYDVAYLDGFSQDLKTAISFFAADNSATLIEKPKLTYFMESLANTLNCEFMGITLEECEYFAAKHGKELERAVLDEHPIDGKNATEWSEEDKYILKNIHDFVKENTIDPNRVNCAKECLNWLNSLPERLNLQPKQEWSEEDEKIANEIEEELWYPGDFPDYPSKEESELYDNCQRRLDWFKNKLKSLRLHPSSNEEKTIQNK